MAQSAYFVSFLIPISKTNAKLMIYYLFTKSQDVEIITLRFFSTGQTYIIVVFFSGHNNPLDLRNRPFSREKLDPDE